MVRLLWDSGSLLERLAGKRVSMVFCPGRAKGNKIPTRKTRTRPAKHPFGARSNQGNRENRALREFDIEGVDFLGADVADEERSLIRGETGPRTGAKLIGECPDPFEIDEAFDFGVCDAHAVVAGVRSQSSVEVDVGTVR